MNKILAIDDNPDNLISVKALLSILVSDCEVITATSGQEGLSKAQTEHPDTILLDIHMPGMDGFEVCRELKKSAATSNIPIVMLTAIKTETKFRVKALDLGADAFLTKPINEAELAAQVKAMLRIKKAEDVLRAEKDQLEDQVQQRVNDLVELNRQLQVEIKERKATEAVLKETENRLKIDLELNRATAEISKELLSKQYDIKNVSDVTFEFAQRITQSRHGFVSSIDKKTLENVGHTLTEMFGSACRMEDQRIAFPIGEDGKYGGLWGHALNTKKPFFTNTPTAHPSAAGLPHGHIPLKNYMAVPVLMGGSLLGLIALSNSDRDYSGKDLELIQRIAEIFALAIHRSEYECQRIEMEQNLRQMQKNEAIGALAGGIAHDFNNILFPIVGFAEMLKEDISADSPMMEGISEILTASKRAKELVKQILTFSRQAEQEIVPLKPQLIVKEVIKLIKSTIPTTIAIRQRIDSSCRTILADPTQIHQITMNLITNSYHAMEESGGALSVSLENKDFDEFLKALGLDIGPYILLSVQDTGIGMDPQTMEKIFDPYFSTKPQGKGTGLGLSVVHGIVKNYGGEIEVESELGKGSTFNVYLPAFENNDLLNGARSKAAAPQGSEHILLVDDEIPVLRLEKQMLERLGYEVHILDSSVQALKEIQTHPDKYQLMITDMTMPEMTGDVLAREVKQSLPDFPIIICTGFSEKLTPERASSIGINKILSKPVIKMELAQAIRQVLD